MANYCVYSGGNGTSGAVAGSAPTATEWSNAYQNISACLTAITETSGDIIFVAHDHSYTSYAANTSLAPTATISIISIDRTNTTTATPLAGALEGTNGSFSLDVAPSAADCYVYGLTLRPGTGGSLGTSSLNINNGLAANSCNVTLNNCDLWINSTNGVPFIGLGVTDVTSRRLTILKDCRFRFGNAAQVLILRAGRFEMYNNLINSSGVQPTVAIKESGGRGITRLIANSCDFSYATNLTDISADDEPFDFRFINCIVPSNVYTGTHPGIGAGYFELQGCGTSTDDHNYQYSYLDGSGQINQNTGVYLTTGGASFTDTNGSLVSVSLQEVSSANASKAFPLKTPWFNVEVPSTGSKTFSVKIANTVAALKDTEVWLELEYMADSTNSMTTNVIDAPVVSGTNSLDILAAGTNRTDTAEAWTGITGEITHTLSKTVTVNQIGWARARVCLAKASTTIYVDPKVRIS